MVALTGRGLEMCWVLCSGLCNGMDDSCMHFREQWRKTKLGKYPEPTLGQQAVGPFTQSKAEVFFFNLNNLRNKHIIFSCNNFSCYICFGWGF